MRSVNLKVVSFNILCCDAANGNAIAHRAPRLRQVLEPLEADLMGFQEATPVWLELLNRDYGDQYEIYNVWRGANSHESTPILWKKDRFECLDRGNLWFSDTPETESRGWDNRYPCPRIFTWARLKEKAKGREFCFLNTHFGFGEECQTKSAGILTEFARAMNCPCVITGDFNMEPDAPAYQMLSRSFRDVNMLTEQDPGATFHGFDPANIGEHIDYCFITSEVQPKAFRVLRDTVDGKYPSDHYGLFSVLELA